MKEGILVKDISTTFYFYATQEHILALHYFKMLPSCT
jgi:hypothetical protein